MRYLQFSMMSPQSFHEIFSTTIDYVVERVHKNPTLQIVPNTLLVNPTTSPIFATVLVEYLLERMEEMGSNVERSNLYLKLFKLVFGSVSLFAQENENMLRPHLHQIVNRLVRIIWHIHISFLFLYVCCLVYYSMYD